MMITFLKKHVDQIIVSFLFLGPIFDLITGLNERFDIISMPITYVFKIFFLMFLILYVALSSRTKTRTNVLLYIGGVCLLGFVFLINLIFSDKSSILFYNAQQFIKAFYYPVTLVCFYSIYEKRTFNMNSKRLATILGIYLFLLWIPTITRTGFNGYTQGKSGNVGWFYSMNEIGAIISILLPFLFLQIHRIRNLFLKLFSIVLIVGIYFSLGSKAPILSLALVCVCYYVLYLIKLYHWRNFKAFYAWFFSGLLAVSLVFVIMPRTSFYKNIETHVEFLGIKKTTDLMTLNSLDRFIFSDRLSFLDNESAQFIKTSINNKLVGSGTHSYRGKALVETKTVEMDYFDVFFDYGILGFLVYFAPIAIIWRKSIYYYWKKKYKSIDLTIYFSSLVLGYGLAFMTGHVLLAPSVSIYMAAIHILLIQKGKDESDEERIYYY